MTEKIDYEKIRHIVHEEINDAIYCYLKAAVDTIRAIEEQAKKKVTV